MIESTSPYRASIFIPAAAFNLRSNPQIDTKSEKSDSQKKLTTNVIQPKNNPNSISKETKEINSKNFQNLDDADQKTVDRLKQIERAVKAHEQSHISAGGGLIRGGASYSYQTGPDGKRYIVGGEVQIDTSTVPDDPQSTIMKMQRVKQAALAPTDPSGQDKSVAAQASKMEAQARAELSKKQLESFKTPVNITKSELNYLI